MPVTEFQCLNCERTNTAPWGTPECCGRPMSFKSVGYYAWEGATSMGPYTGIQRSPSPQQIRDAQWVLSVATGLARGRAGYFVVCPGPPRAGETLERYLERWAIVVNVGTKAEAAPSVPPTAAETQDEITNDLRNELARQQVEYQTGSGKLGSAAPSALADKTTTSTAEDRYLACSTDESCSEDGVMATQIGTGKPIAAQVVGGKAAPSAPTATDWMGPRAKKRG